MVLNIAALKSLPVIVLLGVSVISGSCWYGYQWGAESARNKADADMAMAMQAVADRAIEQAKIDAEIAERNEADQQAVVDVFERMEREVQEYIRTNPDINSCGLDDDGLRLWNEANSGSSSEDTTGESDEGVPNVTAADVGPVRGPAE